MGGACSKHGEIRNAYTILFGKADGKRPTVKSSCRWEDNIKMDPTEIGCKGLD
jgi:hypothetical protein